MKLVFAHDHKLRRIGDEYYTTGGLSDSITGRYLAFFDSLTIFCRVIKKQTYDNKLFKIKNKSITIKPVSENGSLMISKEIAKEMEDEISSSDGLIVKLHSFVAEKAIKYARKHKIPYLVELVGDPWDAYWNHGTLGKIVAPWMYLITKREVKRAPYVIYVTKEYLEKRFPTNGNWIACSDVELNPNDDSALKKRIEKIRKINSDSPIIIGTLAQIDVKYKGQEYVIAALSKLKNRNFIYKIAGNGNKDYLTKIAKKYNVLDKVEFCGNLDHSRVFDWLDSIDFYIQPSKQEGLPRSLAEAISRACPAAGSNVGGIGELINHKYLFKKGNVGEIVNILDNLDKQELEKMAIDNFNNSKNYNKQLLDKRRNEFYKEFATCCSNSLKL
ncbi:glycosyltransferase family 4 protein [Limosilactobacillus mucosae]|uniref:glycosyltransferase family 4 protein n=1 Tax=Limosilactobacillus mucosae TaxID=97478 RepID=UPI003EBFCF08